MTDPNTPAAENEARARRPIIASAVVVAAILVLGLVVGLSNVLGDDDGPPKSGPPATSTSGPSGSSTSAEASTCGLPQAQDSGTVVAAPAATWSLVGTTAAPTIKDAGPGKSDPAGYRSCYARTPLGALVAAANYAAIGSEDSLRKKFYELATVPGPGRDALLQKPVVGSNDGDVRVQLAGFRVLRYDGHQADVDLAMRTSKGAVGATVLNLEWSDGDWKIRLADDGSELSPFVQIPDLTGYIPWSGA